jgi:ATP-dependent RNA helicase DHX37/DHR1
VDAGRAKAKLLEADSDVQRIQVRWISQASAEQRAGRAGRTGPGHCYRLFSSAVFNDLFPSFAPPEITNTALDGVVLSMRAMGLPKAPSPPPSPLMLTLYIPLVSHHARHALSIGVTTSLVCQGV